MDIRDSRSSEQILRDRIAALEEFEEGQAAVLRRVIGEREALVLQVSQKDGALKIVKEERDTLKWALHKYINVFLPGVVCPANDFFAPNGIPTDKSQQGSLPCCDGDVEVHQPDCPVHGVAKKPKAGGYGPSCVGRVHVDHAPVVERPKCDCGGQAHRIDCPVFGRSL